MLVLTLLTFWIQSVWASIGDEREPFISCVKECLVAQKCHLNWLLAFTAWTCEDDCKYSCMRADLAVIKATGARIVQYYGKWPFIRVAGAQEIFSVIFSLGNLVANLYGFFWIYRKSWLKMRRTEREAYTWMDRLHRAVLVVNCNAWLQSAVFHYRDLWLTERLDYFSACLLICSTLPVAVIRTRQLKNLTRQLAVLLPIAALYLHHIWYMTFVSFDYGYNIKFNATIGALSNCVWMTWAYCNRSTAVARKMLQFTVLSVGVTLMVAIDFPAILDLIDMHAMWHLATIPMTVFWYEIIALDAKSK
jgi:hypothetical protein